MFAFHVERGPGCLATGFGLGLLHCPSSELLHNLPVSVNVSVYVSVRARWTYDNIAQAFQTALLRQKSYAM